MSDEPGTRWGVGPFALRGDEPEAKAQIVVYDDPMEAARAARRWVLDHGAAAGLFADSGSGWVRFAYSTPGWAKLFDDLTACETPSDPHPPG